MNKIICTLLAMLIALTGFAFAENETESIIDKTAWQPGYISVTDYGACGTGAQDDIDAIQRCIDENPGQTIYFPAGKYLISKSINLYASRSHSVNLVLDPSAYIYKENTRKQFPLVMIGYVHFGLVMIVGKFLSGPWKGPIGAFLRGFAL